MADLAPAAEYIALLHHVDDRKVLTNENDNQVYLDITDPPVQVSDAVVEMQVTGWVWEPADSLVWQLTDLGREAMQRGAP